ncbi:MAG TPA: PqqD family protein [Pyrinomonadaceae bacterium]
MINPQAPTARKNGLVVQEMPDEVLVYDLETDKAHCLNQTAAFVWKNCDGKTSVNEIVAQFEKQQGSKINEDLVWLAIDQLSERKLLENSVATKFAGESRRSVLKKIGFASVVALPVIASLVAPTAVLAVACSGVQTPASCGAGAGGAACNSATPCSDCGGACQSGQQCRCSGVGSSCTCQGGRAAQKGDKKA